MTTNFLADAGVVLAGGGGKRLGGIDKGEILLSGERLGERAASRLISQADRLIYVGADTAPDWIEDKSDQITFVSDARTPEGAQVGPLGGVIAALEWLRGRLGKNSVLLTAPVDAPFFPTDIGRQMVSHLAGCDVVLARNKGKLEPAFGLWRSSVLPQLKEAVFDEGMRALRDAPTKLNGRIADVRSLRNAFLNINQVEDLKLARELTGDTSNQEQLDSLKKTG